MKKFLITLFLLNTAISTQAMTYDDAMESSKPMVLYMFTEQCPFCQKFNPNFTTAQNTYKTKFNFVKENINTPYMSYLSDYWDIKGVPFVAIVNPITKVSATLPNSCLYDKTCFMNTLKQF